MLTLSPLALALVACFFPAILATDPFAGLADLSSILANTENPVEPYPDIIEPLSEPTPTLAAIAPDVYVSPIPWSGGEYVSQVGDSCGEWGCGAVMPTAM